MDVSLKHITFWLLFLHFISTPKMINPMSQHTQEWGENKKNNSCCIHTTLSTQLWANFFFTSKILLFFSHYLKTLRVSIFTIGSLSQLHIRGDTLI